MDYSKNAKDLGIIWNWLTRKINSQHNYSLFTFSKAFRDKMSLIGMVSGYVLQVILVSLFMYNLNLIIMARAFPFYGEGIITIVVVNFIIAGIQIPTNNLVIGYVLRAIHPLTTPEE